MKTIGSCTDPATYIPSTPCGGEDCCETLTKEVNDIKTDMKGKQAKLTAGENITISDENVISSTGGGKTYTAGENINISDDDVISVDPSVQQEIDLLAEMMITNRFHVPLQFSDRSFVQTMNDEYLEARWSYKLADSVSP